MKDLTLYKSVLSFALGSYKETFICLGVLGQPDSGDGHTFVWKLAMPGRSTYNLE